MKTIVAATDFSGPSQRALQRAALLAAQHRASLQLLYVPDHGTWSQGSGMFSDLFGDGNLPSLDEDRARLRQLADALGPSRRLRIDCHVVPGKPAQEIAAFAQTCEADLIVLAARGSSGLRLRTVGSTALRVLWSALVPVLVVRGPAQAAYQQLVVGTDLGERAADVVRAAHALAPKAAMSLLHAFRGEFENALSLAGVPLDSLKLYREQELSSAAKRLETHWKTVRSSARQRAERVLVHGHPVSALLNACTQRNADLLAIGKHAGPRWEEQMIGSVVQNLVQQARADLLIVP